MKTKRLVMIALFMALTAAATFVIKIPTGITGGYVNLGDCLVLLSAYFLGPVWGAVAAGIGSSLSDLLGGYMTYVLPTLVIKAAMAAVAGGLFKKADQPNLGITILCGIAAEMIMVLGYFLVETILLGSALSAATAIPGNCIQGIFGMLSSAILYRVLSKNQSLAQYFKE